MASIAIKSIEYDRSDYYKTTVLLSLDDQSVFDIEYLVAAPGYPEVPEQVRSELGEIFAKLATYLAEPGSLR